MCTGREKAVALTKEGSKKRPERAVKGYDLRTPVLSLGIWNIACATARSNSDLIKHITLIIGYE